MRFPSLWHPVLRSLPALAAVVAFAACGAGDSPLEPASDPAGAPAAPAESAPAAPVAPENIISGIAPQTIAWISYRTGWTELWTMDPLGAQATQVTTLKNTLQGVSWSWNDKQLATVRYRPIDAYHGHNDIWLVNADGTNGHWARAQTFPYNVYDPSFSPDGSRIVMTVDVNGTKALGWIELASGKANLFWKSGGGALLGWKPTYNKAGTKILYSTGFHLEQINPDGSGHAVRVSPGQWVDHGLFSPDGKKIVYELGASPGNIEIYVKDFSTATTKRLTNNAAVDRFASFSPDGTKIVFMSDRSGKNQIYKMDAATGGSLVKITNTAAQEWAPIWSH